MDTIGTDAGERIDGTRDGDRIDGAGGNDYLWAGDGGDHLIGGAGDDRLDGHAGRDLLFGGAGNDNLYDPVGEGDRLVGGDGNDALRLENLALNYGVISIGYLDGGAGDDVISVSNSGGRVIGAAGRDRIDLYRPLDTKVEAGDDADSVYVTQAAGRVSVDLGGGSDMMEVVAGSGAVVVTMGAGYDTLTFTTIPSSDTALLGRTVITDFTVGLNDVVNPRPFLAAIGIISDNPFADGFLRLVQRGDDAVLQLDRDADGVGWERMLVLRNLDADTALGFNFAVIGPDEMRPIGAFTPSDTAALLL